jgi:hypothetical protein
VHSSQVFRRTLSGHCRNHAANTPQTRRKHAAITHTFISGGFNVEALVLVAGSSPACASRVTAWVSRAVGAGREGWRSRIRVFGANVRAPPPRHNPRLVYENAETVLRRTVRLCSLCRCTHASARNPLVPLVPLGPAVRPGEGQ